MKKIILNTFIATASLLSVTACSDSILDTEPLDTFSAEIVWSDPNLAQSFVYNSAHDIVSYYLSTSTEKSSNLASGGDDFTDNIATWKTTSAFKVGKSQMDHYFDMGWSAFDLIRKANLIIENGQKSEGIPAIEKPGFIAQGHMLRALVYFKQAKLFGKYVIVDKVLTPEDELALPRTNTIKETYDFILSDLDFAIANLPESGENGTLTKGFALALKAEVALHGAAYIESGQEDYYNQCIEASETLFAMGKYAIDSDYKGLINDYTHSQSSAEMIFAMWRSSDITLFKDTPMQKMVPNCEVDKLKADAIPQLVENFVGWPERVPTWDLSTAYLVIDEDGIAKKYDETQYYKDWQNKGGYVSSFLWKNRDARFEASLAHDSTYLFKNLITTRVGGNCDRYMLVKGQQSASRSGFWMRKGLYEQTQLLAKNNTSYCYPICRLGRSYLNYAEALLRIGRTADAVSAMNVTRTQHGQLPALTTTDAAEVWKYYKIERRVELFYECSDRYWSLLRWAKADGKETIPELNHGVKYLEISADGKSYEIQETFQDAVNNTLSWESRRFLFPVPQTQRELNTNLDQNPGW